MRFSAKQLIPRRISRVRSYSILFVVGCCVWLAASLGVKAAGGGSGVQAVTNYPVGPSPVFMAKGDFDGNGVTDLVVVNNASNTVSVLLGKGDGTFQPAVNYFVGSNPSSVVVGDFNGDGKQDLAVALHGTAAVTVLLGNGDGTFQPEVAYGLPSVATSIVVGDFNKDGKLDLAVADDVAGSVSVLLGNGDGTFKAAVNYTVGAGPDFVVTGDFNGDGNLDLVVANGGSGTISMLKGVGDGTFGAAVNTTVSTDPDAIAVADFNGDGKLDIAVTNGATGVLLILLGNGDTTFQTPTTTSIYFVQSNPTSLAVADLNGDGKPDLVLTNHDSDTVGVMMGIGDGTFYAPVNYIVPGGPASVVIGDFNGDHNLDLAIASDTASTVSVLLGNPGGSFPALLNYSAGAGSNFQVSTAAADFNGDGKMDLVAYSPQSSSTYLTISMGNGDGSFQTRLPFKVGIAPTSVVAADFNGDGKADLAVGNDTSSTISVFIGNGDGTFAAAVTYTAGGFVSAMALGDFNHDGITDICVATPVGISVLLGNGDGTFKAAVNSNLPFQGETAVSMVVADLNGDGNLDLAIANPVRFKMVILLGNGDGTFRLASQTPLATIPTSIAFGDLNGDGKIDLVVGNQSFSATYSILFGNGDGTFQAPMTFRPVASFGSISAVAVGDFNQDGILDIALTNNLTNKLLVLLGNGNGTFQVATTSDVGALPNSILATDLNGDGKTDLTVGMAGGFTVLVNTSTAATTSVTGLIPSGGAMQTVTQPGGANPQTGYARVDFTSGAAPYGTAVFSLNQNGVVVSETAVPSSPPTTSARLMVEYRNGVASKSGALNADSLSVNTGIALVNEGNGTAHLTCQLFDALGNPLTSVAHGNLPLNSHVSLFVSELNQLFPDFVMPGSFASVIQYGSLQVQSDQPFSVLALRLTTNQRGESLMSSTPMADLTKATGSNPLYLPRVVDGGGWKTSFYLMNTSSTGNETGKIEFLGPDGSPLTVQSTNGNPVSSFDYSIPANGVYVFQTDGSPATTNQGWIRITPGSGQTTPVGAGIFSLTQGGVLVTESGMPTVLPTTHARIYVDKSGGHDTGLALANPGNAPLNATLSAFQPNGATSAGTNTASLAVGANGETAGFVGEWISGLPEGFTGVLDISSSTPFVPLTLRTLINERGEFLITTFPVADYNQPAPSPIVFPQIANGGGYQTEFIFLSTQGAVNTTLNYFNNSGDPVTLGKAGQ